MAVAAADDWRTAGEATGLALDRDAQAWYDRRQAPFIAMFIIVRPCAFEAIYDARVASAGR